MRRGTLSAGIYRMGDVGFNLRGYRRLMTLRSAVRRLSSRLQRFGEARRKEDHSLDRQADFRNAVGVEEQR